MEWSPPFFLSVCFLWSCKFHGDAKHTFLEFFDAPSSVLSVVLSDLIVAKKACSFLKAEQPAAELGFPLRLCEFRF